tara:strand:+ start:1 stop:1290 length:1290 start_codon:yes stop_codon:yes gene_type:complete
MDVVAESEAIYWQSVQKSKSLPLYETLWMSVFKSDPCGAGSPGGEGFSEGNTCQKRGSGNSGSPEARKGDKTPDSPTESPDENEPLTASEGEYSDYAMVFIQNLNNEAVLEVENPHIVNPQDDPNNDGITDAARVGLPADMVPPPPDQIPRMPNLTADESAAERSFAEHFEADPEGATDAYFDMVVSREVDPDKPLAHKTFSTDDAKMLSGDYAASPENRAKYNIPVHQTANAIAKKAFLKQLDAMASLPESQRNVLITQGGVAAGKGYATGNEFNDVADEFGAVWDSAGEQNGTEMPWIQGELDKRGIKGTYVFVHADPLENWTNPKRGAIERAKKKGRMVDARLFAESYNVGAINFEKFMNQHKDRADFIILDNRSDETKSIDQIPKEDIPDIKQLYRQAVNAVLDSDAPEHIKRGATIGSRIFTTN